MGRKAVASIALLWLVPVSVLLNRIVPHPYMDEIFHVPQAQEYCRGNFASWDPMITTPPGLYFLSVAYIAPFFTGLLGLQQVSSYSDVCSVSVLRFTNVVLSVICSVVVYDIIIHLRPSLGDKKATLHALVLSLYPLQWFFAFLYYTDVASLTAVLAMYLSTLKKKYLLSSLFGALSIFIRQTNVIWMLFAACTGVIEFTRCHRKDIAEEDDDVRTSKEDNSYVDKRGASMISKLRRRRVNSRVRSPHDVTSEISHPSANSSGLLDEIQEIIATSWFHKWELLVSFSPFVIILLAFVAFVFWNGSIVLGAKDAHAVSPHFAQVLYYSMVATLFMLPVHFSFDQAGVIFRQFSNNSLLTFSKWFAALTAGLLSVHFFSIAHPYLLADNRHYTFYLWRKVINCKWQMKYLMVPLYVYSWFSIFNHLAKSQKKIWILAYFLACAAVLIPAPLIEFRYYTIPFFFLALHTPIPDNKAWLLMGILYLSVNCFTMFMFLFRSFSWKHETGIQRFIW